MADSSVEADWRLLYGTATAALQAGDFERAIQLYSGFLQRWPAYAEAYYKRAVALNRLGRLELALADYDRAIALNPEHGNAFCNRGFVLEKLHRLEEAMRSYDRAGAINPDDFLVPYNRASILRQLGRLADALLSYEQAIAIKGDFAEAFVNRGNVLQQMGRHEEAVASYRTAISSQPIAAAFQGLGTSLLQLKRFEDAITAFNETLRLNPAQKYILGMRRNAQMQICDWSGLTGDIDLIVGGVECGNAVCPPHAMLALVDSPLLHRSAAEIWAMHECPANDALGAIPVRRKSQKIRIGYFSADFRNHPVALLTAELFEFHDREKFEIIAFGFGPESKDAIRARLERAFDRFIDVRTQSDLEIASLARRLEIDIAVDLGGFTEHSRTGIFALRAAPIQMSYIGYLGTMSAPYMDYLVADAAIIPDAEQKNYAEKIVYLRSYQANDSNRTTTRVFTREDLGLPPQGFVFSCFNSNYKILPATFATWMRILKCVENSSLYIYSENDLIDRNLRKEAVKLGVDPKRIIFGRRIGVDDYLARFRAMDLFLDTLPYNAGTTASDALWAGLPVLTCTGRSFAARVATSLLRAIDLPELITSSPEQYENLAVQLAQKPESLAKIKAKLQRNRAITPLFDTRLFAANLERAYIKILERLEAGLPPDHIRVDA